MKRLVYVSGRLVPKEEACVSVYDHGLLYGDGVFEGIRVYGGQAFRLEKHVRRLFDSARSIRLAIPMTAAEMSQAITDTVAANSDLRDGYIRVLVTRGVGNLGLNPNHCGRPAVIIIVDTVALYPPELYEKGLAVITAATMRNHPNALSPRIKSMNYLNNILAKIEGLEAGVPEVVMLNHLGMVAECSGDNIFIVRDGQVRTPSLNAGALEGITREEVLDICRVQGRVALECDVTRHDLYIADECFLTGTAAEVIAVTHVDGRMVGDGAVGPVTKAIQAEFRRRTHG